MARPANQGVDLPPCVSEPQPTNEFDVAVAKYRARTAFATASHTPLKVASFFLVLLPVYWAIGRLAGRSTQVNLRAAVTVSIGVTLALTVTLAGVGQRYRRK